MRPYVCPPFTQVPFPQSHTTSRHQYRTLLSLQSPVSVFLVINSPMQPPFGEVLRDLCLAPGQSDGWFHGPISLIYLNLVRSRSLQRWECRTRERKSHRLAFPVIRCFFFSFCTLVTLKLEDSFPRPSFRGTSMLTPRRTAQVLRAAAWQLQCYLWRGIKG